MELEPYLTENYGHLTGEPSYELRRGQGIQVTFESHTQIPGLSRVPHQASPGPTFRSTPSRQKSRKSGRSRLSGSKRHAQPTQDDVSKRSKSKLESITPISCFQTHHSTSLSSLIDTASPLDLSQAKPQIKDVSIHGAAEKIRDSSRSEVGNRAGPSLGSPNEQPDIFVHKALSANFSKTRHPTPMSATSSLTTVLKEEEGFANEVDHILTGDSGSVSISQSVPLGSKHRIPVQEALSDIFGKSRRPAPSLNVTSATTGQDLEANCPANTQVDTFHNHASSHLTSRHTPTPTQKAPPAVSNDTPPPTPLIADIGHANANHTDLSLEDSADHDIDLRQKDIMHQPTMISSTTADSYSAVQETTDQPVGISASCVDRAQIPTPPHTPVVTTAVVAAPSTLELSVTTARSAIEALRVGVEDTHIPSRQNAVPPISIEAISTLQRVSANLAQAISNNDAAHRENQLLSAVGILNMCLQVHFAPHVDARRAAADLPTVVFTSTMAQPAISSAPAGDIPKPISFSIPLVTMPIPTGPKNVNSPAELLARPSSRNARKIPLVTKPVPTGPKNADSGTQILAKPPSREASKAQLTLARATISNQADQLKRQADDTKLQAQVLELRKNAITRLSMEKKELEDKCSRSEELNKQLEGEIFRLEADNERLEGDKQRAIDRLARYVQSSSQSQAQVPRPTGTVATLIRKNQLQKREIIYQRTQLDIKQAHNERMRQLLQEAGIPAGLDDDPLESIRGMAVEGQEQMDDREAAWEECDESLSEDVLRDQANESMERRKSLKPAVNVGSRPELEEQEEPEIHQQRAQAVYTKEGPEGHYQDNKLLSPSKIIKINRQNVVKVGKSENDDQTTHKHYDSAQSSPTNTHAVKGGSTRPRRAQMTPKHSPGDIATKFGNFQDLLAKSESDRIISPPKATWIDRGKVQSLAEPLQDGLEGVSNRLRRATVTNDDDHRSPWERSRAQSKAIPTGPRNSTPPRTRYLCSSVVSNRGSG